MKLNVRTTLISLVSVSLLTSCFLEEPKPKAESVMQSDEYEKVLDTVVGVGSISPEGIVQGQKDTRVETIIIPNSFEREVYRRQLTVTNVNYDAAQKKRTIDYAVQIIARDNNGNVEDVSTVARKTEISVNAEGYYEFYDSGNDMTVHSWDYIIGLRGFCDSFETEKYKVEVKCANLTLTDGTYGTKVLEAVPVRVLSLIRAVVLTEKSTGLVQTSKLRYTIQLASGLQEISKIVSYCSEGLQNLENQIYYLVRCNNLESL